MTIDGYWRVFALRGAEDTDFDVVPVPTGPAGAVTRMASNAFCITANSQVRDAAWEFVKFFQSPETRLAVAERGASIPPQASVARSPDFIDPSVPPAHVAAFIDVAEYAQPDPLVPYYDEMTALITAQLDEVYAGGKTVADVVPAMKSGIDEMIARSA
jgi:multiple sugar transport system substrate-binding protein